MPTFNNPTKSIVEIKELGITLNPGDTSLIQIIPINILNRLHLNYGIVKVKEEPFYNPLVAEDNFTFVSSQQVTVNISSQTNYVEIYSDVKLQLFIQDIANTPGITIIPQELITLRITGRADLLILQSSGAGYTRVQHKRDNPSYEMWGSGYSIGRIID